MTYIYIYIYIYIESILNIFIKILRPKSTIAGEYNVQTQTSFGMISTFDFFSEFLNLMLDFFS